MRHGVVRAPVVLGSDRRPARIGGRSAAAPTSDRSAATRSTSSMAGPSEAARSAEDLQDGRRDGHGHGAEQDQ
ncbi:hypothetical protein ACQEVM_19985 [Streptomyces sp. CA-243310]|uniref:hypothetical protein n=1 Tax=Streptomyces sp. CA-243310 TaxID=3240056 RepID=UPI003D8D192D